jgi:hypothetical protein
MSINESNSRRASPKSVTGEAQDIQAGAVTGRLQSFFDFGEFIESVGYIAVDFVASFRQPAGNPTNIIRQTRAFGSISGRGDVVAPKLLNIGQAIIKLVHPCAVFLDRFERFRSEVEMLVCVFEAVPSRIGSIRRRWSGTCRDVGF